jgi:histidine triad (HIT) family protein
MVAQQQGQPQGKPQYTPEQIAEIKKKLASMSPEEIQEMIKKQCVFCKIVKGEIPGYTIYEDEKVLAFLDIQPANPGHVLVVPKEHFSVLPQMPDDDVAYLFSVVKQISSVVFDVTGAEGVEIRQRNGQVAGQAVPHVHVHVIPRFQKDGVVTDWAPQKISEEEFKKIQSALAGAAKNIKISKPTTSRVQIISPEPALEQPTNGAKAKKPKKKQLTKIKRHP